MEKKIDQPKSIRVGITHGDVNGIGYEIMIKALSDNRINELMTPIVYGSSKVASFHRKFTDTSDSNFNLIKKTDQASQKKANIINITEEEIKLEIGKSTTEAGQAAYQALELAVEDIKNNEIDVVVTAPINKKNMQQADFAFPGHTEYLASKCETHDVLMLMVGTNLRIGVVTGHVPLEKVSECITEELILNKLSIMESSLLQDFAIRKPKIAVLGLNPHAGDDGVLGEEENKTIIPAINKAFENGTMAFGPFPADGFFGSGEYKKYDGILAMYHDQGLIPFKSFSPEDGVNFTAGLPIIRTSPAHGTAYEIAGKNEAHEGPMREAMYLACDIYRNRKLHKKISADPLKSQVRRNAGRDD